MTRKNSKKYYENNRENVLERMRNYNANKKENCSIKKGELQHKYFITKYCRINNIKISKFFYKFL